MRINLARSLKGTQGTFIKHLVGLYAEEFDASASAILSHIKTGDPHVGEYFVSWLRSQGWQVSWYQMPIPDDRFLDNGEWQLLSFGLHLSDACDKLITWKLSNP